MLVPQNPCPAGDAQGHCRDPWNAPMTQASSAPADDRTLPAPPGAAGQASSVRSGMSIATTVPAPPAELRRSVMSGVLVLTEFPRFPDPLFRFSRLPSLPCPIWASAVTI